MGKKKMILVFEIEICGGRKVRESVEIEILKCHRYRKQMGSFWRGRREGFNGGATALQRWWNGGVGGKHGRRRKFSLCYV